MTIPMKFQPCFTSDDRFDLQVSELESDIALSMMRERGIKVTDGRVKMLAESRGDETNRLLKAFIDADRENRGGGFLSGGQAGDSGYARLWEGGGFLSAQNASVEGLDRLRQAQKEQQATEFARGLVRSILQDNGVAPTVERIDAILAATGDDEVADLILRWQAGETTRKPKGRELESVGAGGESSYQRLRETSGSLLFGRRRQAGDIEDKSYDELREELGWGRR